MSKEPIDMCLPVMCIVPVLQQLRVADYALQPCSTTAVSEVDDSVTNMYQHSQDFRYVTSSGSKGYQAFKEMLQNGKPGMSMMIESQDLTTVDGQNIMASDAYFRIVMSDTQKHHKEYSYIFKYVPGHIDSLSIFANAQPLPRGFLKGCTNLRTLDLSPLSYLTKLPNNFLQESTGLTTLDLTPFAHMTELPLGFLRGCTGLTTLDFSPLTSLSRISTSFLSGCTGLISITMPTSHLTELPELFLAEVSSLKSIDLRPFSHVTKIPRGFLQGCSSLTSIDVSPLVNVTEISCRFLTGCRSITSVDLSHMTKLKDTPVVSFLGCVALKTLVLSAAYHKDKFPVRVNVKEISVVYV